MKYPVIPRALTVVLLLFAGAATSQDVTLDQQQPQQQLQLLENRYHRSLARFAMPFNLRWRFVTGGLNNMPDDRNPTTAEYNGVLQAVIDWFTAEIPVHYADFPGEFREIDCDILDTEYDPTVGIIWHHHIDMGCEAIWDASSMANLLTPVEFIEHLDSTDYMLDSFVSNYLRKAEPREPTPNILSYSYRIGFDGSAVGSVTPVSPVAAPTSRPAPMPSSPGQPTMPQRKEAPPAKCGSLSSENGRGGAASQAKDCSSRLSNGGIRRLKGAKNSNKHINPDWHIV